MIPATTEIVIQDSTFYLEPEIYYYVKASRVGTPAMHRLVCRDDKEITVATTAAGLADLTIVARNQEDWRLLVIECANPFYCVGFLARISEVMARAGLDILLVSTFSRDLVFARQQDVQQAQQLLSSIGFVAKSTA